MPLFDHPLIAELLHPDPRTFEAGQQAFGRWADETTDRERLEGTLTALGALSAAALGPSECFRRGQIILRAAALAESALPEIARAAADWSSEVRNAALAVLPQELRRSVFPRRSGAAPAPVPASPSPASRSTAPAAVARERPPRDSGCRTVLLLGAQQDHESNHALLENHSFAPLRAPDFKTLDQLLSAEICGVVVARSWWAAVPPSDHRLCLERLVRHSSFCCLKIDVNGLQVPAADVNALYRAARYDEPRSREFSCGDGCRLIAWDIECLERASTLLSSPESVRLCPAEIHPDQVRVLLGAASKHVQGRHFSSMVRLTQVTARDLPGGRSGARIVRLTPDDDGVPLVAKIHDIDRLEDEMRRFRTYIAHWDADLSPCLHFHAGTGLILFSLVEAPGAPGQPAPTLEERMDRLLLGEPWDDQSDAAADLAVLIDRAVDKLSDLNARPCRDPDMESWAWLGLDGVDNTLRKGLEWEFRSRGGETLDVFALRKRAVRLAQPRSKQATVHGDVQLRNVLVRDRTPHLIDYALSGPGHPCFDLARLEASILFHCFRMTAGEWACTDLFRLLLEGSDEVRAARDFPLLCAPAGNRLAVRACVRCREAALKVLRHFNGDLDDFLAVKYIVACQSLFYPHLQTGVVRAALLALTAFMRGRDSWRDAVRDSEADRSGLH
jgi:hypothetical protein